MGDFPQKLLGSSVAISKRVVNSIFSPYSSSQSSAPSLKVKVVKLQECPEIFDEQPREAKLAIRATDLECWKSSFRPVEEPSNTDPKAIQHWALVVYFPLGKIIHFFEGWDDDGQLQAGRAQFGKEEIKIFEKADYIGTAETSPRQLLEIAKQVKTGKYSALGRNNCQTWLVEYLERININCGSSLSLPDNYRHGIIN